MFMYIQALKKRRDSETGASAVEYGLLVALIAAVIVVAVIAVGHLVNGAFKTTCSSISSGNSSVAAAGGGATC